MLITPDQIRAARGLKNWSQTELATRTGLAVPTIANIELGKQIPGKNTMERIIDAFSIGGIRFTANGVEFAQNEIFALVGEGKFKNLLNEALSTLSKLPPKERFLWAMNAEDIATTDEETEIYKQMIKNGISLRRIISEKAGIEFNEFNTKIIEHKYSDHRGAVFMFGDKTAFYTSAEGKQPPTTFVVTNARISEIYKKMFNFMWDTLKIADKKTLTQKKGRK